jgi:RecB family exonuclease/inactivated superfamily I helicase
VITARATRLVRARSLHAFREAAAFLAIQGEPLAARDRLVIVPTRAAAEHLVRSIEDAGDYGAVVLPDFATAADLVCRFAERLGSPRHELTSEEREVLLRCACRSVVESGIEPPFRVRPGLVAEIVRFYDDLRSHQKDVDTFERLALGMLEPGAADDRGARQLVQQTRFLAAVFSAFERSCQAHGADEHELRQKILTGSAARPYRHVLVTVADRTVDAHGLAAADWDLLARTPGIERLDVLVTDQLLAGALHQRLHDLLPGIQEERFEAQRSARAAAVVVSSTDTPVYVARDREEEVAAFARRMKVAFREGRLTTIDRAALVVHRPLPYVYLARSVFESAGLPCQYFDTMPLAAEPYAAALDLVLTFVGSGFARVPGVQLLRSPHFSFGALSGDAISARDLTVLDRALSESGYAGDFEALGRLAETWSAPESSPRLAAAVRVLHSVASELVPLRAPARIADHLLVLRAFLQRHASVPSPDDPLRSRHLRARGAVMATIASLHDAHRRFDDAAADFDEVAALLRRWIDGQTFAPRTGDSGIHVVDSASAPFGRFEHIQLAGVVDGEWPDRPRRNIFYSSAILRELGWPAERDRSDAARASFVDLLLSPGCEVAVSGFLLEHDTIVSLSPLIDELAQAPTRRVEPVPDRLIFDYEALAQEPIDVSSLAESARDWATFRTHAIRGDEGRFRGLTGPHEPQSFSLSALERYQDCPFKFFASDVLRLEEPPDDGTALSPRARGRFVHELLQQFFAAWDARSEGGITPARLDAARALFVEVAEPLLRKLPPSDAALERTRLFGSALSVGIADVILSLEASRPDEVRERWLEFKLEGDFSLCADSRRVSLRGVADRIDLLDGNRLRVVDYKTGAAPERGRALQVPVYALCAQQRLAERDGTPWTVDEALYISFSGKKSAVRVAKDGDVDTLSAAGERVFGLVERITRGEFPPQPHDVMICSYCAYSSVCRKDYVE